MPRVTLLTESTAPAGVRQFWAKGNPGPIPASLAGVPDVMLATLPFLGRVLGPSTIDARTKEIVILRASALQKCRYCTQTHSAVALDCGLSKDEVQALRGDGDVRKVFKSAAELALIAWTEAVAAGSKPVEEALLVGLRKHFGEAETIELTLLVGATVMLNRYATAFDLPVSEAHLLRLSGAGLG
jgi:AhpD family alkylhydroperoxidase